MAASQSLISGARWAARLVLGGAFGYAALLKLADPRAFATDIGNYHLLPHPLTLAFAVYLPWLELVCALAVLLRWRERGALTILAALCLIFTLALASAWLRGLEISCGCFGHAGAATDLPLAVGRSVALGLIALGLKYDCERMDDDSRTSHTK